MISLTSPVETRAHGWPAGLKLALLAGATVALFAMDLPLALLGCLLGTAALYALPGRVFFTSGLRRLWGLWPFVLLIGIWHVVTGEVVSGAMIVMRMLTAVALANLVTMTSKLSDMMGVVTWLIQPLRWLGVRTEAIPLAMALTIRFTPVLVTKGQALAMAWRARSAKRPGWQIVLPFAVTALDDADHVAEALRARGGL